jgi:hypothetical protein
MRRGVIVDPRSVEMSVVTVVAVIAIIAFVISRQLVGGSVQAKRLFLPGVILTAIGITDLCGHGSHPNGLDIVLITMSAVIAIGVGIWLAMLTRLEQRDGFLWAQLPRAGLWAWGALIASRLAMIALAHVAGAPLAAGSSAVLFTLGLNRLAQAGVVGIRAVAAGIPFAPEQTTAPHADSLAGPAESPPGRP